MPWVSRGARCSAAGRADRHARRATNTDGQHSSLTRPAGPRRSGRSVHAPAGSGKRGVTPTFPSELPAAQLPSPRRRPLRPRRPRALPELLDGAPDGVALRGSAGVGVLAAALPADTDPGAVADALQTLRTVGGRHGGALSRRLPSRACPGGAQSAAGAAACHPRAGARRDRRGGHLLWVRRRVQPAVPGAGHRAGGAQGPQRVGHRGAAAGHRQPRLPDADRGLRAAPRR